MSLGLKSGKRRNHSTGQAKAHKQALRDEAKERQAKYDALSTLQKLELLVQRGSPKKERTKLILKAKKEGLALSSDMKEKLNL